MKQLCAYIIFFLLSLAATGQELSFYRSYLAIPEIYNPAYNGALECTHILVADKHQWLGIEDAPSQQIASANIRIERSKFNRNGIGIMLLNDLNGDNNATGLSAAFAKHFMVKRSKGQWLGMGLSLSGFYRRIDKSEFIANYQNDPLITQEAPKDMQLNASGGVLYYSNKFETGLSFYQIIPYKSYIDRAQNTKLLGILHAQYHYHLLKTIRLVPGFTMRYEYDQHLSADINLKYEVVNKYWVALSTRMYMGNYENTMNSILIYLGYNFRKIAISYSTDIGFTGLQGNNWGGHELTIAYRFCKPDCGCTD